MNEPVVATTHSSSSSACGSTAATTPFFKIAGPSSLAAAAAAAASQSFLAVLPAAAPDPQLGVCSAAAAAAAEGRPGAAAAAAAASALPTATGALPTAAAAALPTAAAVLPATAAALARKRKEVVGMVSGSGCSTSEDVDSCNSRLGRSGGGGCAEGFAERDSGAPLSISSLLVGAEAAAAEEGRKGVAGVVAGLDCGEGSDCSTRSCASRSALPLMKEVAHSSDEDTRTRSDRQTRCSHRSRRRTGEEEADCEKINCSNAFIVSQGERQLPAEEECRVNTRSSSTAGNLLAAERDRRRKHSARRRGHSRRRDTREGSARHRKDRAVAPEQQGEERRNRSGSGLAASRQKKPGAEGQRRRRGTAELYEKGLVSPYEDSFRAQLADYSASDEDVVPGEERIAAPDVLTLRCGRGSAHEAAVTGRAAAAVFCVDSSVSAVAVGRSAVLGERGEVGPFSGAEKGGNASSRKTPVPEDYRRAASKKRGGGAEELEEAAEVENPASRYAAGSSFSGKSRSTREAAASKGKLGRAGGVLAASEYSVKPQDVSHGYMVDVLSVGGSVEALLCSSTGDGDSSLASSDTAAAAAAGKTSGDCVGENTSSRGLSEEVKKVGGKRKAGGGGEGAEFSAAANQGTYRSGVSATATADSDPRQTLRGASSSKAVDSRVAATPASRRHEQAGAAAADLRDRPLLGNSLSTSNASGTSSTGGRRAAAAATAHEGGAGGGGRARGGKKGGESDAAVGLSQGRRGDSARRTIGGKGGVIREDSASGNRSGCNSGSSRSRFRGASGSEMAAGEKGGRPGGLLLCAAGPGGGGSAAGVGGDLKSAAGCVGSMRGSDFCYNSRNAGTANVGRAATVMNRPTRVEAGRQRFLILDAPSDENLPGYIDEMKAFNVTHLVRTCEATYDDALVRQAGICTHEWVFPDGEPPPEEVIDEWLTLCNSVAAQQRPAAIAVHCVAGLGRAPVLVAVALIEKGMDPMDAIMFIRERRKGAINRRQLQFLKSYRRRSRMQRCCIGGCRLM